MENKFTHIKVEVEVHKLLKELAKAEDRTMIVVLRKAILDYAKKQGVEQ